MKKTIVFISLLCLIFTSCETEIKYDGEITQPQMVVFANLMPDSIVSCYVLHSFFFMDVPKNVKNSGYLHEEEILKDAVVRCKINDGEWIALDSITPQGTYISSQMSAPIRISDKVMIDVEHPTYGHTSAEQVVPKDAKLELIDYTIKSDTIVYRNRANSYRVDHNITIRLKAYSTGENTIGRLKTAISQNDRMFPIGLASSSVVFAELNGDMTADGLVGLIQSANSSDRINRYQQLYYPMEQLSDKGEEMVLYVTLNDESANMYSLYYSGKLIVYCDVLSEDSYLYMASMQQYASTSDRVIGLGLQEKVQIFGNFSGDVIGCLSAQTNPRLIEIDLPNLK